MESRVGLPVRSCEHYRLKCLVNTHLRFRVKSSEDYRVKCLGNKHLGLCVRFREEYRVNCGVKFPLGCRHMQNLKRQKQLAPQN